MSSTRQVLAQVGLVAALQTSGGQVGTSIAKALSVKALDMGLLVPFAATFGSIFTIISPLVHPGPGYMLLLFPVNAIRFTFFLPLLLVGCYQTIFKNSFKPIMKGLVVFYLGVP